MINDDIKDEIKNRIKLSEIISKKIYLKKKTDNSFIGLCPFHSEKTPSFHVNDEKKFYHCFGCEKHGDIFTFIMEYENMSFTDSVKYLGGLIGLDLNNKSFNSTINHNKYKILEITSNYFKKNLFSYEGKQILGYLKKRGISKEICEEFSIGYAPSINFKHQLLDYLKSCHFQENELLEIGLVKQKYNKFYGYFYDRLIIPIVSMGGRIIGFGGRTLGSSEPKYLNSPESEIFSKRNTLFGAYNLKKNYKNVEYIILCEGYMDAISLYKFNYPAVASLGTAVSDKQIELLCQLAKKIFIVFDGDQAGKNASIRLFEKLLSHIKADNTFKFVFLPNKLDPEEYITQRGKNEFDELLTKSFSIADIIWLMGLKNKNDDSPEEMAKFWKFIRNKVYQIKDKNLSLAIKDDLEQRINELRSKKRQTNIKLKNIVNLNLPKIEDDFRFKAIIIIILNFPELYTDFEKKLNNIKFSNNSLHEVKEVIFNMINEDPNINKNQLINNLENRDLIKFVGDFSLEVIFSKLLSSGKQVNINEGKKILNELIYMIENK